MSGDDILKFVCGLSFMIGIFLLVLSSFRFMVKKFNDKDSMRKDSFLTSYWPPSLKPTMPSMPPCKPPRDYVCKHALWANSCKICHDSEYLKHCIESLNVEFGSMNTPNRETKLVPKPDPIQIACQRFNHD